MGLKPKFAVGVALAAFLLSVPVNAGAADPLPFGTFTCGVPVTQSFRLSSDKSCPGTDGLVIGKAGITVDLNGKTIRGDRNNNTDGVVNSSFNNVTVKNGVVRAFGNGVLLSSVNNNVLRRIQVVDNAGSGVFILGGNGNTIKAGVSTANDAAGVIVEGTAHIVRGNQVTNNAGGIRVTTASNNVLVVGNTVSGSDQFGIEASGTGGRINANRVTSNGHGSALPGIRLSSVASNWVVRDNVIVGNGDDGYRDEGTSNKAVENVARGNGFFQGVSNGFGTGIDATAATTPKGRDNRSSGNDAADQCEPDFLCA